jgi:hypothetical protein
VPCCIAVVLVSTIVHCCMYVCLIPYSSTPSLTPSTSHHTHPAIPSSTSQRVRLAHPPFVSCPPSIQFTLRPGPPTPDRGFLFPRPARPNIRLAALCRARRPPEQQNQKQAPVLLFSAASARRPCCARSPTRAARFDSPALLALQAPSLSWLASRIPELLSSPSASFEKL